MDPNTSLTNILEGNRNHQLQKSITTHNGSNRVESYAEKLKKVYEMQKQEREEIIL